MGKKQNCYYAHVVCAYRSEGGKYSAIPHKLKSTSNIISQLRELGAGRDLDTVQLCGTMKEARELAIYWNECYKRNGTYMFE